MILGLLSRPIAIIVPGICQKKTRRRSSIKTHIIVQLHKKIADLPHANSTKKEIKKETKSEATERNYHRLVV